MPNLFDVPIHRLKEISRGEKTTKVRQKLNAPIKAVNQLTRGIAPPQQVKPDASRSPNPIQVRKFIIKAVSSDYLITDNNIKVAKPPYLRQEPFDGQTISGVLYTYKSSEVRSATRSSDTEDQIITPGYSVGDTIFAIKGILSNTVGTTGVQFQDKELEWLDLNVDARQWAAVDSGLVVIDGFNVLLEGFVIITEG